MDVLNKLRSTVSSTVSTLSGVLPGNPVTREFEASNQICSAGPGLLWSVYEGYKKSTKQEASIFVFEKKQLDRWPRESREAILESMKRGVSQLTKLRHPQVLIVQHPLEESRDSLAFATEPVAASLANIICGKDSVSTAPGFRDYKLYDVETKYGLLQVAEGLTFLHNDVKLVHNNICPESIVINLQGAWKIFGFDFCVHQDGRPEGSWKCAEHSPYLPHVAQPNLDYLAPEAGLANSRSPASDLFSLGVLIYAIHNDGAAPQNYQGDLSLYKGKVSELKSLSASKFNKIPQGLREIEKMLLSFTAELRPDAHQFRKIDYFEDVGVKTLNYLDSLFQWDKLQKSQFYKGLPTIIENFPQRVCVYRVVPCLAKEFANPSMVPFVLPVVLQIAEKSTKEEYKRHIFPHLQAAMKLTEPAEILLIFMQKMELLLKITPAEEVKSDILPMLYRALDSDAQQIQELCLTVLPTYATLIDYPSMKNALLPRIKKLCIKTAYLSVRVNCLVCIGKLLEHLDKWLVLDEVLPFLPQVPSREPAVLMSTLGIYKIALTHKKLGIPKEILATKVIPFLVPITIENGLTVAQFNIIFSVLKDMINRVETEQRTKVEQLNAISQETKTMNSSSSTPQFTNANSSANVDMEAIFGDSESHGLVKSSQSGLSMDEKQSIMRQQEAASRFGAQGQPIAPTPMKPKTPNIPKDLTSTFFESNLANLSVSNRTANAAGSNSFTNSAQQNVYQPSFNSTAPQMNWQPQSQVMSRSESFGPLQFQAPAPTANNLMSMNFQNFTSAMKPAPPSKSTLSSSEINDFLS